MVNAGEYRGIATEWEMEQIKEFVFGWMHGVLFPGQSVTQE
jgi:hypothetical protein